MSKIYAYYIQKVNDVSSNLLCIRIRVYMMTDGDGDAYSRKLYFQQSRDRKPTNVNYHHFWRLVIVMTMFDDTDTE